MPSVLPYSSTPAQRERFHCPALRSASACGMLRAWASINAIVCSAADSTFDCGALTTITPRLVAAATSTLSSPMPGAADDDEIRPGLEHLRGDLRRAADHERRGTRHRVDELLGREPELHVDLEPGGAHRLQPALGQLFGHQDALASPWLHPLVGRYA